MTDEMKRRVDDTLDRIFRILTPLLLLAIVYFVKPIVDAVPRLERQAEVAAVQQQQAINTMTEVGAKQESTRAELINIKTKVEVMENTVRRLERKIDP